MKRYLPLIALLLSSAAQAAIHTESVVYKHGGAILEGYLAYDDASAEKRPGVIVVHEWTGLNDYAKRRAEQIAGLGYVAFAADIYGQGQATTDLKKAGELSSFYKRDRNLMRGRMDAAMRALKNQKLVDTKRIAAIGYCFGGTCALEFARAGADLKGVVSFHGNLDTPTPEDAKDIRGPILICRGADDPYVPKEQVEAFENEMRKGKVDWQENVYGDAVHGFTNSAGGNDNAKGYAYNEKADKRSWEAMKSFFVEIFRAR